MLKILLLGIIFVNKYSVTCLGELSALDNGTKIKITLVQDILKKVCNLTLDAFANTPPLERKILITKIEEKLNKSAHNLGNNSQNYVQLMMKSIRSISNISTSLENIKDTIKVRRNKDLDDKKLNKQELIDNIAKKIDYIAKKYFQNNSSDNRNSIMEKIKKQVENSANRRYKQLHNKQDKIKAFSDIIAQGIEKAMKNNTDSGARRMEFEFINNVNVNKSQKELIPEQEISLKFNKDKVKFNAFKPIPPNDILNFNMDIPCHNVKEATCSKIKTLNVFMCESDHARVSLDKLCDGMVDCPDNSDELKCSDRALEIVRSTTKLMSQIESSLSRNCYPIAVEDAIISKQNEILRDVLKNQMSFIQKHSSAPRTFRTRFFDSNMEKAKKSANEVASVVNTLSMALRQALCNDGFDELSRKNNDVDANTESMMTTTWSPISCVCKGQYCKNSRCKKDCSTICWQKYNIDKWQCNAINHESSISVDALCDGKLDCFDESDERDCAEGTSHSKFEANIMYNLLANEIASKASTVPYEAVRRKLYNLRKLIQTLHKTSVKRNPDVPEVKRIREQCFSEMISIYDTTLFYAVSAMEMFKTFVHLKSLTEMLVSAMKRSHTGNEHIISTDGCFCHNYECMLPRCSKMCQRACAAEPKLTRYGCHGSTSSDKYIQIKSVCNGKKDCPNGDDEKGCVQETCRKHHLMMLRHNIRDVGEKQRGTALGEALKSWKIKVISTLTMEENNGRPTYIALQNVVSELLRDLLATFSGLDDYRRANMDQVFYQFYNISRVVMKTLKFCGH